MNLKFKRGEGNKRRRENKTVAGTLKILTENEYESMTVALLKIIILYVITNIYHFYQPFHVPRCSTDQKKNSVFTPTATELVSGTSWTLLLCILQQWTASRFIAAKQYCSSGFALTIILLVKISTYRKKISNWSDGILFDQTSIPQ